MSDLVKGKELIDNSVTEEKLSPGLQEKINSTATGEYLPLSGGHMTGPIRFDGGSLSFSDGEFGISSPNSPVVIKGDNTDPIIIENDYINFKLNNGGLINFNTLWNTPVTFYRSESDLNVVTETGIFSYNGNEIATKADLPEEIVYKINFLREDVLTIPFGKDNRFTLFYERMSAFYDEIDISLRLTSEEESVSVDVMKKIIYDDEMENFSFNTYQIATNQSINLDNHLSIQTNKYVSLLIREADTGDVYEVKTFISEKGERSTVWFKKVA